MYVYIDVCRLINNTSSDIVFLTQYDYCLLAIVLVDTPLLLRKKICFDKKQFRPVLMHLLFESVGPQTQRGYVKNAIHTIQPCKICKHAVFTVVIHLQLTSWLVIRDHISILRFFVPVMYLDPT